MVSAIHKQQRAAFAEMGKIAAIIVGFEYIADNAPFPADKKKELFDCLKCMREHWFELSELVGKGHDHDLCPKDTCRAGDRSKFLFNAVNHHCNMFQKIIEDTREADKNIPFKEYMCPHEMN